MASPLTIMRRYQKALLAVFGVIIMFTFVIGGGVDDYFRGRATTGPSLEPIVTWSYGSINEQDLQFLRHKHQVTMRFLEDVLRMTRERKGVPKIANVTTNEFGQVIPGLRRSNSPGDFVQTLVLAKKAEKMGIVVDDEAVFDYLTKLSDGKLEHSDYASIVENIPNRFMTAQQIFDELRIELAAHYVWTMSRQGFFALSPASAWQYYQRVHHRVRAEVLPIPVTDYTKQVGEPSEKEIQDLYEEAKTRYSHPDYPEPGFRKRKKASFEYLKVDFKQFLEAEKKKVTDEEIRKEYDARVARGDFKVPELPPLDPAKPTSPPTDSTPSTDAKPEEKPAEKPADAKPDAKPEKPADAKPDAPKPEEPKPDAPKPDAPKPDAPKPDAPKPDAPKPDAPKPDDAKPEAQKPEESKPDAPKPEEPKPDAPKPEGGAFRNSAGSESFQFVSLQNQTAPPADSKPIDKPEVKPDEKPAEKPADKPADEKPAEKPAEKPSDKPASDKPVDDKPTTEKPADQPADKPADKPVDEKPAEGKPEPKVRPLEEVRDEIARALAQPRAEAARKKVFDEARIALDEHSRWYRGFELAKSYPDATKVEERKFDMEALADKLGLEYGKTPLLDGIEVFDQELGKAANFSFAMGFQQISFSQLAYRDDLAKFRPEQIMGQDPDIEFLFWKTDEKAAYVPELKEVRDEVIEVWKKAKAVTVATKAAEEKAEDARSKKSLAEAFGDAVKETNEFSWMSMGAVPFSSGVPSISRVDNIDTAGVGFMEAVFKLKPGEVGVALNHPQSVVYVVRVIEESPSQDVLRERFLRAGTNMEVMHLAMLDSQRALGNWYAEIQSEMNVQWRPGLDPSSLESMGE